MTIKNDDLLITLMENNMNEQYPHKGEEWVHKDGSGLVIIDAMLKYDTFYTNSGIKWTCGTETFKKMYMKKDVLNNNTL